MSTFIEVLFDKFRPYKRTLLIVAVVLIFAGIAFYVYKRYMKPELITKEKGYDDIANRDKNGGGRDIEVLFFHANWCPHCKKCEPDWQKFYKEYNGQDFKNRKIVCTDVDCSDDNDPMATDLIAKYKVEGFPTVIGVVGDKTISFDAKVTKENLEEFISNLAAN